MDNNHMLAIIEQKMCFDDHKVWSRFLETTKCHTTLEAITSWMTSEMKLQMRATAPNCTSMSPSDCVKAVKEDHSCFYFCKYFHHPLIHIANAKNSASTLTVSADNQFFPSHCKSWDQETKQKKRKPVPGL